MRLIMRTWWLLSIAAAQWNVSGSIHPVTMNRTSDGSSISLPFRIAELEIGFSKGDFDLKTNSAVEYRWTGGDPKFDLREAYTVWFPNWGEVKFGKQIHAWGVVDGNNPTDNLNAYDYYFMFLQGTDRKVGSLSAAMTVYWGDWQLEGVIIPDHIPNRMPFDEPDFPFQIPIEPSKYEKIDNSLEYGVRLKTTLGETDIGISYFDGRDRFFSLLGVDTFNIIKIDPKFGYRATSVFGLNMVTFIDNITIRAEAGYFTTKNDFQESWFRFFDTEAEYVQYVIQFEYRTVSSSTIGAQLIGNHVLNAVGQTVDLVTMDPVAINTDNFVPGLGTPFAMFTDLGMFLSATGNYWDNALEIRGNTFMDLEDSQKMLGGGVSYSPMENWAIDCSISKFMGEEGTHFKEMENFSHLSLGVKYSF